ncbi:MAG: type II toxin-antitoxin system prevent-host-death family antitoxin [Planctomycetales bacterium]|nr:type II toxin-antitoxin system prevent-host-death family antitoxin [Planctomycetales bacterium]
MPTLTATEFKAKCLAILDRIQRTRETVILTKRGKPVAQVAPVAGDRRGRFPQHALRGSGRIVGDIDSPAIPLEEWNAFRGRK